MSDAFLIVAFLIGYLLGSIPFGMVLTKLAGTQDLRSIGSGNIGATNVLRTGRKGLAAATLIGDMLKGTIAVIILGGRLLLRPALRWIANSETPEIFTAASLLLVVATAPLEGQFGSGSGALSVTKIAGYVCIAAFLYALVKEHRRLVLERGQALVLGILGLALLSTAWAANETSAAITTTTRYAGFAVIYVIITQFGHDRVLQHWEVTPAPHHG